MGQNATNNIVNAVLSRNTFVYYRYKSVLFRKTYLYKNVLDEKEVIWMTKRLIRDAVIFVIGGLGYLAVELLWRARTHITMFFAGGICFLCFLFIVKRFRTHPLWLKALYASLAVTAVELAFGLIFNMMLDMHIWDYSEMPLNLFGQICVLFSFAWAALSLIALPLCSYINDKVEYILDM